jgi:hypothetical protein
MDNEIIIRQSIVDDIKPIYELLQKTFDVSYKDAYPQEAINPGSKNVTRRILFLNLPPRDIPLLPSMTAR